MGFRKESSFSILFKILLQVAPIVGMNREQTNGERMQEREEYKVVGTLQVSDGFFFTPKVKE